MGKEKRVGREMRGRKGRQIEGMEIKRGKRPGGEGRNVPHHHFKYIPPHLCVSVENTNQIHTIQR